MPILLGRVAGLAFDSSAGTALDHAALALVGLLALRAALSAGHIYVLAQVGESIVLDLRTRLFRHLLALGPRFHDDARAGGLVSRLISDVGQVQGALTGGIAEFVASALTLVGAAALMARVSPRLALAIMLIVPPVALAARLYARAMHRHSLAVSDGLARAGGVAEEAVAAIRVVQLFVREDYESDRFATEAGRVRSASLARLRAQAAFQPGVAFLSLAALVIVMWLGGREVARGAVAAESVVSLLAYAALVASAISGLVGVYGRFSGATGASRRIFDLLDLVPDVEDAFGAVDLAPGPGRLAFEGVWFKYDRGGDVLADVDLEVLPGQTVALVGPSGAGKTTLTHLVARYYDPTAGRVTIDGQDVRQVTVMSVRQAVAVVPQDTVLFNASVADNIRYGRLTATDTELVAAARAAHAEEFISRLPDGYATHIGERGVKLSAGQRQRIAIARALLKDPRILLLDEATASLDSASEAEVQAALDQLLKDRTTLVVAHRLSTVVKADLIVVLDAGRIVESGRHSELVSAGGLYAALAARQFP